MNVDRLYRIIVQPHLTEKSMELADNKRQFAFRVAVDATKPEIKIAVQKLFKVTVTDVKTVNVKGKTKMFRQKQGRRSDWKKAYVTLQEGDDIDFVGQKLPAGKAA